MANMIMVNYGGNPYQFFSCSALAKWYSPCSRRDYEPQAKLARPNPAGEALREGESLEDQHKNDGLYSNFYNSPYLFNAKELDEETGLYYYGARYSNPVISQWLSVDPLAHDYPHLTPYNLLENNPVNMVDPTGMGTAPIYNRDGDFLGTDDQGLQGKAIVMDEENFKQGMSHDEALSKSVGAKGLNSEAAKTKLLDHKAGLKDRPDWDGKLTLSEVNEWYQGKSGDPLYVDAAKIDLSPVEVGDFKGEGSSIYKNYVSWNGNSETGLVYGTIKLTLTNKGSGQVRLGGANGLLDKYDFDYQSGRPLRNIATWAGKQVAGEGKPFLIYNYGTGRVKK